ncbi:Response regulator containing a CheY-like receiver domain and an HTH DNA-binding domain|uniref:Regulatory LuxR family protein n=1 Tax=Brenneria salicis ATCC 15712 = DSM 30166 TaxID=714314 RepID=A0A366HWC4_9GAMM|nr:helix-turn-helix transcriptional regulator [Brenneria salicis]NMN92609.1 Response regulator containing a CheY-like receiver domain and an HTH DNA-binding domain [Brenneria salicis ATCC 15712 = DSM 30166]RBP57534.1 regulatory LuxR family protein [Brenneria salicis ATCC 15712 = DSM 30166]RLM28669.1 helix-turn-helix transcriptional regulator [Brenneria salicis ATCC 15712 = DSM 30166]
MASSLEDNADYIRSLITMMEGLDEPWGIKDLESRHVYMNKAAYLYTNTPHRFDVEGRLDEEFPASWTEMADDMIEHDRRTESSAQRVAVIETHYWYGNETLMPFICEKIPIFDKNKVCIGTIWNSKQLNTLSPLIYINQRKPSTLTTELTTTLFTKSELDVLFLILQRFSNKEIARRMNVSHKTIENRVHNMYQKAGVHSLSQFEAFCHHLGLDNYIPDSLISKGVQFI